MTSKLGTVISAIFVLITSSAQLCMCGPRAFCAKAVAVRSCPKPPTVNNFNLKAYLGRWYEIGSTARFKLSTEAGVACDQAVYSSTEGKVSLLNSGLQVINGATQVRRINTAAGAICSGARDICFQVNTADQVSDLLKNISSSQSVQLAHALASTGRAAVLHLDRIAEDVTYIQQLNALVSQANASSLRTTVAGMNKYADEASSEQVLLEGLSNRLSKLSVQLRELSQAVGVSAKVKREVEGAWKTITTLAANLKTSSSSTKRAIESLKAELTPLLTEAQPIHDPYVTYVTGEVRQVSATSAGKLEVTINGIRAPYWIIGLERDKRGAYSAAMVYSCREVAGQFYRSLFVLSKEPQLKHATLQSFLARAEELGIYNYCEDPFLLTLQRDGTCGTVLSPSSSP